MDEDTHILSTQFLQANGIPILVEAWNSSGIRAKSAVFLADTVSEFDNADLRRLLMEQAGLNLEGTVTIARKGDHVFVNFNFVLE